MAHENKFDVSGYTKSASEYYELSLESCRLADQGVGRESFSKRVEAAWGLIARGAEAVPFALKMLESGDPDLREDGASVLAQVGRDERVIAELLQALATERDNQVRDGLVLALGALRNKNAVPALAAIVEDAQADGDTRWTAVESLGKIVRKRFLKQPEALAAALDWIAKERNRRSSNWL